jgi:hypothetical protein
MFQKINISWRYNAPTRRKAETESNVKQQQGHWRHGHKNTENAIETCKIRLSY